MILLKYHINADITVSSLQKDGWQAPFKGFKVLQAEFFRHSCLLLIDTFMQR